MPVKNNKQIQSSMNKDEISREITNLTMYLLNVECGVKIEDERVETKLRELLESKINVILKKNVKNMQERLGNEDTLYKKKKEEKERKKKN